MFPASASAAVQTDIIDACETCIMCAAAKEGELPYRITKECFILGQLDGAPMDQAVDKRQE